MVSSRLANRLGVAGVAGSPRRRPVTDARQILNARRATAAPAASARRFGLATRGIIKTGRAANLRLSTLRSDFVTSVGGGGNGPLGNRIVPFGRRGLVTAAQTSPRFQARNLRQQAQRATVLVPVIPQGLGTGLLSQRRGLISGSRRLAAMQQIQAAQMDIDERIPQARNKRIQVNPNGISVTTANPFMSRRQGLLQGRRGESPMLDDDDDLERLTLDDVLGRPTVGAPAAARLYRANTAGLGRPQRASTSLSRIQHRLDGRGLDTPPRRSPSEPLQGVSVLVSNLHPQVTESDIRDLFQDIGPMHDARMVGVSTALATFHRHADAMKAYKTYHGRLLDGQPMNLTVLTLDQLQSNQR
uniref:Putative dna polymerase delta n=1 Tax=Amblyomma aureolatum TaxID=187763 RepID=A0A1E1XCL3_9ACAR